MQTMQQRRTEKYFSLYAVNENADENEILFTTENETESYLDIHFRPEDESHLTIVSMFASVGNALATCLTNWQCELDRYP